METTIQVKQSNLVAFCSLSLCLCHIFALFPLIMHSLPSFTPTWVSSITRYLVRKQHCPKIREHRTSHANIWFPSLLQLILSACVCFLRTCSLSPPLLINPETSYQQLEVSQTVCLGSLQKVNCMVYIITFMALT